MCIERKKNYRCWPENLLNKHFRRLLSKQNEWEREGKKQKAYRHINQNFTWDAHKILKQKTMKEGENYVEAQAFPSPSRKFWDEAISHSRTCSVPKLNVLYLFFPCFFTPVLYLFMRSKKNLLLSFFCVFTRCLYSMCIQRDLRFHLNHKKKNSRSLREHARKCVWCASNEF